MEINWWQGLFGVSVGIAAIFVYKFYKLVYSEEESDKDHVAPLPPMKKQDFRVEELKLYNGTNGDGRILIAINSHVLDVSKARHFYGPNGAYSIFGGRDMSRACALFSMDESSLKNEYDDLSDLSQSQMRNVIEWERQLREKYPLVGKLLAPTEQATEYSDSESEAADNESKKTS